MVIFVHELSPRVQYIMHLVFKEMLQIPHVVLTTDQSSFSLITKDIKFNYSNQYIEDIPFFYANTLLFEEGIRHIDPQFSFDNNQVRAFANQESKSLMDYDPFALIFFLVSRYEEYHSTERDHFGRFPAHSSYAYKYGFLDQPVVNDIVLRLYSLLQEYYPKLLVKLPSYQFSPSYDIDYAYAYKGRPFWRTAGAAIKLLSRGKWTQLIKQVRVLSGIDKDPFDVFDDLASLHDKYNLDPLWFFLLANYGEFDKNTNINQLSFKKQIELLAKQYTVGIHPSFQSNSEPELLDVEIKRLKERTGLPIKDARQHFLMLQFPSTYQNLIANGIVADYSMGYAKEVGFRASIASSFLWFDLAANCVTTLRVHPFMCMDVTLKDYLKCSPGEAFERIKPVIDRTKDVGGHFISLWHNSSFAIEWSEEWKTLYLKILEEASRK